MADADAETSGKKQPDDRRCFWLRRVAWLLAGLSIPISVYSLFQSMETAFLAPIGACVLSGSALGTFVFAGRKRLPAGRYRWGLVGLLGLVSGLVSVCILVSYIAQRDLWRGWHAGHNLVAISWAITACADRHGAYPPDLQTLVKADLISPAQLCSPLDPQAPDTDDSGPPYYTSYVYRPWPKTLDGDGAVIIVHDRARFRSPTGSVLHHELHGSVVYADGHREALSESEFAEALRKDAERRGQAGLLTTQSAPAE